ncbi:MAG: hypothetical protein GWO20_06840, partial [Candidatus Korarchaeota archaeon]|nr:hypothetical protein [Candidatus Korarchaeota archaeon]NIU83162.1 hypothetical protein [Candidatus Thorarchaeota archaeon]NIW13544.1 hypothetical protein [Candidatus Thorarchaeota archaeon]NIW51642.1 hypothetical protein [Candidatus Korarchaeota archaeon]
AYVLAEDENVTFSVKYDSGLDVDEFKKEFTGKINQYTAPIVSFSGNYLGRYGIYGGNTGSGVNTYGGRGSANPARNVRPVPSHVPTGNDDPYDMAEEDIREELRKFYSEEEVNEFFQNGEAEEELIILKSLEDQGISVLGNYDNFDDDNSIWEDLGENLEEMTSGLPLADQEEDDGEDATVWDS